MTSPPEGWPPHPWEMVADKDLDAEEPTGGRLGAAFALGVVVGAVASALLAPDEANEPPRRRRRLVPRKAREPSTLSDVAKEEAANLIRGVFRDFGSAATRWLLDLASAPPTASDEGADPGAPSSPSRPGDS